MPAGMGYPNPLQMLGVPNYAPGRMNFAPLQMPQFAPPQQSIFANPGLGDALRRFMFNINRPQVPGVRLPLASTQQTLDTTRIARPQGMVDPLLMGLFPQQPRGLGFGGLY